MHAHIQTKEVCRIALGWPPRHIESSKFSPHYHFKHFLHAWQLKGDIQNIPVSPVKAWGSIRSSHYKVVCCLWFVTN